MTCYENNLRKKESPSGVPDRLGADLAGADVWGRRLRRSRFGTPSGYVGRRPDENMSFHRGDVFER